VFSCNKNIIYRKKKKITIEPKQSLMIQQAILMRQKEISLSVVYELCKVQDGNNLSKVLGF
jgi:hypothetical protein